MSNPIPASEVANIPVGDAANNAAEEAEEHTPEAAKIDPPASEELDPTDGGDSLDDIRDALAAAADRIVVLEETVKSLQKPDEVPVKKKPWTKRGSKS